MKVRSFCCALIVLALISCDEPRVSAKLGIEEQHERRAACVKVWRDEGYSEVVASPSRGFADQLAFEELGPSKQRRMAELSACIRSGGATEKMEVEFYSRDRTLRKITAMNDIDWAN